jgi:hypothetical protein
VTNKKWVWLLLISHWTLRINCDSRGETVAMYSRATRARPWFSPRVICHLLTKRSIWNHVYAKAPTGTHFQRRFIRKVWHGGRQCSNQHLFRSAAFGCSSVLAYRIVVAIKVYIRHASSCLLLLILIAVRDISMYIWYMIWHDMIYDVWYMIRYDMIWYIFNWNWVDTRWRLYSTQLHTNITHNTENGTHIKKKSNLGSAGRSPSLRVIPWHLPYNWGKSTVNPQLG